jgi:PAS domain S-box-containing protein
VNFEQAVELIDSIAAPCPIGFCIIDREFRYLRVNEKLAALNGLSVAEHIGKRMRDVLCETSWLEVQPYVERAMSGEAVSDVEFHRTVTRNLCDRHILHGSYAPLRVGGAVVGVVGFARDITQRTRAKRALERSEMLFQQLADSAEEGVWIVDAEHRTTFVNPRMASMLGYTVDEMLGTTIYEYLDGEAQRIAARYMQRRRATGRDTRDFRFKRKDGTYIWMLIATAGLPDANSEYFGTVGLFTDITARKQAELERDHLLEQERLARAEAERARRRIASTLESITDAFVSVDRNWNYTYVNRHAARMLDKRPDQLFGKNIWTESPEAIGRPFQLACVQAMQEQKPIRIEELEDTSGRWFGYQIFPSQDGLSVFFQEVTELKRIGEEKLELMNRVQETAQQQRLFIKDMLSAATDKRLHLCWSEDELPKALSNCSFSTDWIAAEELPRLRSKLREEGERLNYDRNRIQDLIIGASEAALNAIVHGGGGTARICCDPDGPIQVWFSDHGRGISMHQMPRAVLERGFTTAGTMGHGMKMMMQTVDRIWLLTKSDGTTIVLEQCKAPQRHPF